MHIPFLILLDWMTGSWKSTTARLLADQIPRLAVIGLDRVKRFISDFERGERDNTIAWDIICSMTEVYFTHSISVLVEQPFKTKDQVETYEQLAHKYNIPLYKFQLYTTPEIAFQRVINRQRDKENKVPEERIQHNINAFMQKEFTDFERIDTSSISSEDVAKTILQKIDIL